LSSTGAGVDDEMARRAGRRDPVQRLLEAQRDDRLVFGVRVAGDREGERVEDRANRRRIVLAERVRRDQGAHVEETIGLARGVAIDNREIRPDRLGGVEGDRQGEEQAA
jgi:hypothetical protein